jgi:pyruvate formate lyase activating enzyme
MTPGMKLSKHTSYLDIKGFIETSFLDWDGKIVSVIFLPECNFRCAFCHNMDLVTNPEKFKSIPVDGVLEYLEEHKDFIDGVCITGGEPPLQKNTGLTEFMKKLKDRGFLVKLDTNGTDPEYLKKLIKDKLVDFIAMDIKAPLDKYEQIIGVKADMAKIKESISLLMNGKLDHEFRTTIVPTIIGQNEVEEIAKTIKGAKKYVLQQFKPENCKDIDLAKMKPVDNETAMKMVETAKKYINNVSYRGK